VIADSVSWRHADDRTSTMIDFIGGASVLTCGNALFPQVRRWLTG
jgi:hypothetical protein